MRTSKRVKSHSFCVRNDIFPLMQFIWTCLNRTFYHRFGGDDVCHFFTFVFLACVFANFHLFFSLYLNSFATVQIVDLHCVFARSADTFMLIAEKVKILKASNDDHSNAVPHIMSSIPFYSILFRVNTTEPNYMYLVIVAMLRAISLLFCSLFCRFNAWHFDTRKCRTIHMATQSAKIYVCCVCLAMA